ncbi:MAG TPA: class I SAM-dependent methyltransferase [Solirubrobacteraceae bacterium]|nr:class I SAM-dependent methyltransferase [Solirubrobacteraceae bacterium]
MSPGGPRASLGALRSAVSSRLPLFGRWPVTADLVRPSLLTPVTAAPSERLLDTALRAIETARSVNLDELTARARAAGAGRPGERTHGRRPAGSLLARLRRERLHSPPRHPDVWPGEHYKLLSALVALLRPRTVIELGTATGISALTMKAALPEDGRIFTFDVVSWREYPRAVLGEEDFADGRLEQRLDDLSTPAGWQANAELLRRADFILVDAIHDGVQERNFLRGFDEVGLDAGPIVMFDDIRLWTMLSFWREIARPKLDLTSFGHWSGTGLVDYA